MADNATGATAPKTPPHIVNSGPKLDSTPLAVGSAAISEHIGAVGVGVQDVSPWIARDVEGYKEGAVDKMLEELLYRCVDDSKPLPDKSTLLDDSLKAVLPICNEGDDARIIKNHMITLLASNTELDMYQPFIKAANCALRRLSKLDAPGLVPSKAEDDFENIIFHLNDPSLIHQTHQEEQSSRKPDVVIVSNASAMKAGNCEVEDIYESALKKPVKKFEWKELRTTLEFKHTKAKSGLALPPVTYAAKTTYNIPVAKKFMKYRRETNRSADEPEPDATPLPASSVATGSCQTSNARAAATSSRQTSNAAGRPNQSERDKKRSSAGLADGGRSSKKARREPARLHPVVQNGLYAAEMFAAHFARQSVISYVVENDIIYTWYFDRQGAIQCSGINFVQDLPRFMVLLLAMQRMSYAEWGYHTLPEFVSSGEVRVDDKKIGVVDLKFNLTSDERITHFGLRGRATTVFPVESVALSALVPQLPHYNPRNPTDKLVAKLYWPEEERESEADILQKVYEIAKKDEEGKVKYHVPELVWSQVFEDTSTANIRRALGIDDAETGRRVFYIIVFRELRPITKLSGEDFLSAWWQIVICHYALWDNGVHHRDVSPSNLMVYKTSDGRWIGVLNDFDLSSTGDTPSGQERTGTVPFMALDLLTKEAIKGQVKHLYQHDAESFIWVLTWVCICYEDGVFIGKRTDLNDWLRVDAIGCHQAKSSFLISGRKTMTPSSSHGNIWKMARSCLLTIAQHYVPELVPTVEDHVVFQTWLQKNILEAKILSPALLDVRL
ncbi:uncharacterized protein EDB93DRAFT_1170796 [Suillus bovinus]|uniref:uncharacterized protein n=1 Tax=Suillus bovinus TaxID=48563 RepID=UPI001B87335D|nr:uncharacterized protein EDB93DRAFT_1170796 [Suillus bovinus]KAG2135350.1 hypothetical protein EDB93DRAFT_1170796 [Suillus bovinus]